MRNLKFLLCIVLFVTLSFICSPLDSIAEPNDGTNKSGKETESFKSNDKSILNSEKYSCCDPKVLVPGNPDIDSKMLVPGNPYVDPKMLIENNTGTDPQKTLINSMEEQLFKSNK